MKNVGILLLMVSLGACSSGAGSSAGGAPTANLPGDPSSGASLGASASGPAAVRPVIGQLRTRDRRVTLLAAHDGLRVSIEDESGAPLLTDVPVDALREQDPVIYELCRSSVASNHYYLDARLDLPTRRALH
jgi:hypothetical protein